MQPVYIEENIFSCLWYISLLKLQCSEKVFDTIPLKPLIQQIVDNRWHMTDFEWSEQLTLSTKCLDELTWGLMSLNHWPEQLILWFQKICLWFFMSLWQQMALGVVAVNLNHRGMVGRIYIVNYYALLLTKYISCRLHGFRSFFFKVIPHYMVGLWKLMTFRV